MGELFQVCNYLIYFQAYCTSNCATGRLPHKPFPTNSTSLTTFRSSAPSVVCASTPPSHPSGMYTPLGPVLPQELPCQFTSAQLGYLPLGPRTVAKSSLLQEPALSCVKDVSSYTQSCNSLDWQCRCFCFSCDPVRHHFPHL